jgi:hypothetical protein
MKNVYLWYVAVEGAKLSEGWRDLATLAFNDTFRAVPKNV